MLWIWVGFILLVLLFLALDLGVFHRKAHVVKMKEALTWSGIWIFCGLTFGAFVYYGYENHWLGLGLLSPSQQAHLATLPPEKYSDVFVDRMAITPQNPHGLLDGSSALIKYLTGYVVEKSLSVDNIFVIAMLFGFFGVPAIYQHRVLFWGIIGALLMRGAMIGIGAELIRRFDWILYIFGGFLILTAVKMLVIKTDETDPSQNMVVRLVRRWIPITHRYHGQHFFVRAGSKASHEARLPGEEELPDPVVDAAKPGVLLATPLFLALIMVEFTDLIFAVDSIPAIFAITTDPFLVFTSNVFAILGLRALYFALAGLMDRFRYLKISLALVLAVVGVKMLAHTWLKKVLGENANFYLLAVVLTILAIGVITSWLATRREARIASRLEEPAPSQPPEAMRETKVP